MDGPFYVSIRKLGEDLCQLDCSGDGSEMRVEFSGEYSITDLISAVLNVANTIESICSWNDWDNDDTR